ncbi:tRNA uridine-5-carboxymethylaminomethyl(34) synthesis GTPase MnmE [Rhodospirillaceae bacterium SYSU D60014]|uniref:tRNA uridine-5-carboxymethylaminomethyl(34) synthesis GTPase MnmE n=1 Tax=Virgifigura deserti TaxID=2268457 RepID=UPI000E674791
MTDTIFALASAPGRAGVAVIRVSGPGAGGALRRLSDGAVPSPRYAAYRRLRDPWSGAVIDEALVLWFPGPASFTGEDVAEFHLHGGRAVIAALIDALYNCPGLRPAEPGEFTRRAFENGKLDLTAAEGLADLVNAETEGQRRQALRQMQGELGRLYDRWREGLVGALAQAEAAIDFPDEDLPAGLEDVVRGRLAEILGEISQHLADNRRGERLRDGFSIALIGAPNTGKSSLLNWLAQRDAAIVSATAGTTRDIIEVQLDLGGYPVLVADTAGLRTAQDEIEAEGVRRALDRAGAADLRIALFDATAWPDFDLETTRLIDDDTIPVINKTDLRSIDPEVRIGGRAAQCLSVRSGNGLPAFLDQVTDAVAERLGGGTALPLTRARHRHALEECLDALGRTQAAALSELAVEDLRLAVTALGRITGRIDVEDLLDRIFRDFCIGK